MGEYLKREVVHAEQVINEWLSILSWGGQPSKWEWLEWSDCLDHHIGVANRSLKGKMMVSPPNFFFYFFLNQFKCLF
jgi:hypothetical protein